MYRDAGEFVRSDTKAADEIVASGSYVSKGVPPGTIVAAVDANRLDLRRAAVLGDDGQYSDMEDAGRGSQIRLDPGSSRQIGGSERRALGDAAIRSMMRRGKALSGSNATTLYFSRSHLISGGVVTHIRRWLVRALSRRRRPMPFRTGRRSSISLEHIPYQDVLITLFRLLISMAVVIRDRTCLLVVVVRTAGSSKRSSCP